jgi:hypothetical protein
MHHILAVTVVEREKDLFENLGGHLLAEELSLNDAIEELAASAQLSDEVDVLLVLEVLIKFDNVRMV